MDDITTLFPMGWNYPTHNKHEHGQDNNTDLSNVSSHYSQYILICVYQTFVVFITGYKIHVTVSVQVQL